jgi:triacylglycerol lipase
MAAALRAAGLGVLVVELTPNDGRVGLDELAIQIHHAVTRELPAAEPFSIVGFSMGGLVARSYLRQFAAPGRVPTFISISSPHHGTWTAWCVNSPGARDMRPGSPFLAALDADAPRHHATRWITLRTPLDLMILPSRSSELAWARNECLSVPLHALMVEDRRVIRRVCAALADPPTG